MYHRKRKVFVALLAVVLVASVLVSVFTVAPTRADAVDWKTAMADPDTLAHWAYTFGSSGSHDLPASSENIGRIWVDKSVFTENATVPLAPDNPVEKTEGADFLVGLSALSSASSELTTSSTPLDIVLVLDVSGSMADDLTSTTYTEAYGVGTSGTYYIDVEGNWTRVSYGGRGNQRGWRYGNAFSGYTYVTPKTSAADTDPNHVQFFTAQTTVTSKMAALKDAVNAFLDSTAELNNEITDVDGQHRVALVKFAGDQNNTVGDEKDGSGYNYTQIVSNLTTDISGLKSAVGRFTAAGATSADYGMNHAATVLQDAREKAKQIVIFFTDGEPNHNNGFNATVADDAIAKAKELKDGGADIYTIGVFADADPSAGLNTNQVTRFNRYMHGMSSNYPGATGYDMNMLGTRAENSNYYKAAASSDELNNIFNEISEDMAQPTPPTQIESGDAATTGGYITFVDTLGDYMEVKDLNGIFLDGVLYTERETPQTAENVTTYVYTQEITHKIYGQQNLNSLVIRVTKSTNEKEGDTVTVRIPAALIPVRYYDIDNNEAEDTLKMEIKDERPIRVFYSVGLKDSAEEKLLSGNITDTALLEYLNENTGTDGKSYFYANQYTSGALGDTTATFAPANTNPFYFYTEDTPLYSDVACTERATGVVEGGSLYYKNTYYENDENGVTTLAFKPIAISSAGDLSGIAAEKTTGYLYMPKGTARVNRMAGFTENKETNVTGTASTVISPTWDAINRTVQVFLGNNGRLAAELPGNLTFSKTVTADEGLTAPDKDFAFTVTLTDESNHPLTFAYDYAVTDQDGNPVMDGTTPVTGKIENGTGEITLKAGQTATVTGLPGGAKYTVTEAAVAGFTTTPTNAEGSISSGVTAEASFTNHYSVTPVTLSGADNLKAQKVLNGRQWDTTDSFTFALSPVSYQAPDATIADTRAATLAEIPTPEALSLTVTNGNVTNFGDITFSTPGIYSYAVAELLPDTGALPGMRYSKSVYRVIVTVTDQGDGTLTVSSVMMKTFDDNRGDLSGNWENITDKTAVFTNTYYADAQPARIIVAKNYADNSGSKSLTQNMFYFKLKALTPNAPMPDGLTPDEDGYVKVGNSLFSPEYGDVRAIFPAILFNSADHDGQTYKYELSEDIPDGANAANGYTLNGMTYDPTVYTVQITANVDGDKLVVDTTYLDAAGKPITTPRPAFNNSYEPTPVDIALHGTKTLNGRDMKDGETFDFTLALTETHPAGRMDAVEFAANSRASVSGGQDGVAQEFSFGDITFKKPGQYTFSIQEDIPDENPKDGVTYDGHNCTVTVVVEDKNGVLEVTNVTYNNGAGAADNSQAVFVNTYAPKSVTLPADQSIQVEKVLVGREWKNTDRFFFNLDNKDQAPAPIVKRLNIVSTNKVTVDGVDHYRYRFDAITYTAAGEYTYEIYEDSKNLEGVENPLPGVTYDDHRAKVVVTIDDDQNGNLYVKSVVYDGDATAEAAVFTNTYKAEEITLTGSTALHGVKTLAGRAWTDSDRFAFTTARWSAPIRS